VSRLLFVTQQVDAAHPTLGAAAAMVDALAERVDEVVVLAAAAAADAFPPNVRFHSFAAHARTARGLRFEAALVGEVLRGRPAALLAHMSPIYAVLAAPVLRPLRVPLLLWFTQQGSGGLLRWAERLVDAILSVDAQTVPLASAKVRGIGHGIDTAAFSCVERPPRDGRLRLLSLGRYAEVKGHDVALRALRRLVDEGVDAELTVRGEEATPNDALVRKRLAGLVAELGLEDRAHLLDALPHPQVPALLATTDVLVNATHGAAADKVVFEAAACSVPAVAASPVFGSLLPATLRFADGDDASLTAAIRAAAALPAEARSELRRRVEVSHSVGHWADAVLAEVRAAGH
jgi:glycosyltransferase involved in cell wall biosynthesis